MIGIKYKIKGDDGIRTLECSDLDMTNEINIVVEGVTLLSISDVDVEKIEVYNVSGGGSDE